jgi:hypothetical protein
MIIPFLKMHTFVIFIIVSKIEISQPGKLTTPATAFKSRGMAESSAPPPDLARWLSDCLGADTDHDWAELLLPESGSSLSVDHSGTSVGGSAQVRGKDDGDRDAVSGTRQPRRQALVPAAATVCVKSSREPRGSSSGDESKEEHKPQGIKKRQLARRTPPVRDRTKAELQYLRQRAKELEALLEILKGNESGEVPLASGPDLQHAWKRVARRQLASRLQVESDNRRLKAMLADCLAQTRGMEQFLYKRPRLERLLLGSTGKRGLSRSAAVGIDIDDAALISRFSAEVDENFQPVDRALRDNKAAFDEAASHTTTATTTSDGKQALHLEFRDIEMIPFPFSRICEAAWVSAKQRYERDENVLYSIADRCDDTIAVRFSTTFRGRESLADNIVVLRRYMSDNRMVWVWRALYEMVDELKHIVNDEVGWCVYEEAAEGATSLKSLGRVMPLERSSREPLDMSLEERSGLSKMLEDAFADDGEAISALMENLLLDDPIGF